jgi:PadR family transcriptional regulator PadR
VTQRLGREILLSLWKVHILHHAEEHGIYGHWMIEELAEHGYRVSPGTMYPLLARMERNGWLASRMTTGAKARRTYKITAAGRRVLQELREHVDELHREVVREQRSRKERR